MQITKPVVCQCCHELMEYVKKDDFWKCSNCGGEFWLFNMSPAEDEKQIKEAFENNTYVSRSLPDGYNVPPGGSKKPGKNNSKVEQKKKNTPQKLFEKLFKQT